MYHQKGGCNVCFILKKIKKQNVYPCKFFRKMKVPPFHCHKCVNQKICDVVETSKIPQNPL